MDIPVITPDAGGAAPAAAAPSTPAPSQHSSDRALANFTSTDPAKGGTAPEPVAAPVVAAPPAAAAPAAVPAAAAAPDATPAAVPDDGLAELLGIVPEAASPVIDPNAPDPLEALKDNPRVQALLATETAVKDAMEASAYLKEPAHLKAAVQDAHVLWDITEGKASAKTLLEAMRNNPEFPPERFNAVVADLKGYIEQLTGQPIAAAAAGQPAAPTPEQQRIAVLEKEAADRKTADTQAAFTKRIETTKTAVTGKLTELLKDSAFDGEGDYFLSLVGSKLAAQVGVEKATTQLVEAIEKNDFTLLEKTFRAVKNDEAKRYYERNKRILEMQKRKQATIPNQPAAAGAAAPVTPAPAPGTSTSTDERRKQMLSTLRTTG